jgi:small subunit ribosomal protein S6
LLRKYEILFILRHDSAPDLTQGAIDKVKNAITEQGGTILLHESWGKKKLAYEIKKASKGIYQLTTFAAEPGHIKEIEHVLRIHPEVIKWLTAQLCDFIEDLNTEIEHYSKITPRMIPIDGEETSVPHDESYQGGERRGDRKDDPIKSGSDEDDEDEDDEDVVAEGAEAPEGEVESEEEEDR